MKFIRKILPFGLLGALVAGVALAQVIILPQISSLNPTTDLIQIVVRGQPTANSVYGSPSYVSSNSGHTAKIAVPTGTAGGGLGYANTTFYNDQTFMIYVITGTMTYAYTTTPAIPSDGQRVCISASGAALSASYLTANTGQTVTGGTLASLSANTAACWVYSISNTTWDRS